MAMRDGGARPAHARRRATSAAASTTVAVSHHACTASLVRSRMDHSTPSHPSRSRQWCRARRRGLARRTRACRVTFVPWRAHAHATILSLSVAPAHASRHAAGSSSSWPVGATTHRVVRSTVAPHLPKQHRRTSSCPRLWHQRCQGGAVSRGQHAGSSFDVLGGQGVEQAAEKVATRDDTAHGARAIDAYELSHVCIGQPLDGGADRIGRAASV